MVQGVQKHVLSLKEIKGYGSKANSVDFAFVNIWRNPEFVAVKIEVSLMSVHQELMEDRWDGVMM